MQNLCTGCRSVQLLCPMTKNIKTDFYQVNSRLYQVSTFVKFHLRCFMGLWILLCIDYLTLSWQRSLSYRNQSNDLQNKSMDWFLYETFVMKQLISYLQWTSLLPFFEAKLIKPWPVVVPVSFSLFNYLSNYLYNNFVFNVPVLE